MVGWVLYADSDEVDEIEVDLEGVLLPDDTILELLDFLSEVLNDDSS